LIQSIGWLTQQKAIKGLGALTVASPLPIVFTQQKGLETFALDFYLKYEDADGKKGELKITPELYSQFDAPYNYRNVIGAAVSYGPILPEDIRNSVYQFCFQEPGKLTQSLGLTMPLKSSSIYIKTKTQGRDQEWSLTVKAE
jgi:hypothetical protein